MASEMKVSLEQAAAAEERTSLSGTAEVVIESTIEDLDDEVEAEDLKESEEDNTSIPSIEQRAKSV
jgi:hypothetical protein